MGVPGWLLKIIGSYLSKRTMVLRFKGSTSNENSVPGGAPQGTILGVLIFIFQMNKLNTVPSIPRSQFLTPPGVKQQMTSSKFMDDNITVVAVDLKNTLRVDNTILKPPVFHSRTGHSLPNENNPLIPQVDNIVEFTNEYQMKLNIKKTNIMLFSRSKSRDFQPEIFIENQLLDVVESTKLLGTILSTNMKWDDNVEYIRNKAMKSLWKLRRIKELGGSVQDMLDVYILQIRCLTERDCPLWHGSLPKKNSIILEGIQKSAAKIILGQNYNYNSYTKSLKSLNLDTLANRRDEICLTFAKKASTSSKFQSWFRIPTLLTRTNAKFALPTARTATYENSPLIHLTKLLNSHYKV